MKRQVVSTYKPHMDGLTKLFGTLEAEIIDLIWEHEALSGREVFEALRDQGQRLSSGAVRTVLERLVAKQVLTRELVAGTYIFRATRSRQDYMATAVGEIIDSLFTSFGEPVYAQFLSRIQAESPEQLQRLSEMISAAEARAKQRQA